MAFDGFIVKSIISELNSKITNGKINKVYQPSKNEIIIDLYNKKKYLLYISIDSSNCRINLTTHPKSNPKVAPNFCMLLRKYLNNAKILFLETYNLDRIIIINLENYNDLNDLVKYKLVVELMGKHSNIILLNEKDIIIDSMRHINSNGTLRDILPANPYTFPISNKLNILDLEEKDFIDKFNLYNKENNLINICCDIFTGFSKAFMVFTLQKLNINHENFNTEDLIKLYKYIKNIMLLISENKVSCENFTFNSKEDFCIIPFNNADSLSINSFVNIFYLNKEAKESFINYRNTVLKLILSLLSKYNKKLINIQEKLNECNNMDKYKLYGELITANLYKINNNINLSSIELENYYDNNNLITINLDNKISPSYNAKKFFKKYNKLKHTLIIVNNQKIEIKNEISYLESIVYSLNNCTSIEEIDEIYQEICENILQNKYNNKQNQININKKEIPNIKPLNIENFDVYIGKNNKQNDYITFKLSSKNDLWFHTQGFHGSHILLKTQNKEISEDNPIILKCAKLAALNSKASNENKVLVDYTLVKNLKKPNGSKPGFVIFNNYKTIIVFND